ncbi:MAG: diaminopimelate decarboxylase [Burkholderiales bacterium]
MNPFVYRQGALHAEGVALSQIAEQFGTPCYVYSRAALTQAFQAYDRAFGKRAHLVCYSVKANSSLAVLGIFAKLGSGFDIVSGGELARVLAAGGDPRKIVFSGVGKTLPEMRQALGAGVLCFNVESESELLRLEHVAREMGMRAAVSLRVNPDVDARTHPYISTGLKENKFGVAFEDALRLYRHAKASAHLNVVGVDCHIGSQLLSAQPIADAVGKLLMLVDQLAAEGITIEHLDLGGGLGIRYQQEVPPSQDAWIGSLLQVIGNRPQTILIEPGRSLVGNAGLLLTRVEYLKHGDKNFAVVDAAMNDLIRPALYDGHHEMLPVVQYGATARRYDVVGPICESADFLARNRELALREGDLLAAMSAGAYGMAMSSNYNSRPRAAEVIVDGEHAHLVRDRERVEDLYRGERVLD